MKKYEPLDLSRRCDSVDTIKTPSPYNMEESSQSNENSPISSSHHNRSSTYSDHHTSHTPQYPQEFSNTYQSQQKLDQRDTPSPDITFFRDHKSCNLSPYMIQAAALQQRLGQHSPPADDDTSETSLLNKQNMNSYPMQIVGRDGKLSRPFKAYPRDPLSMASFSLVNAQSAEKFEIFRLKMLKHIHAANGGQATISNPKMRRTSSRAGSTNIADNETANNNNSDSSNGGVKDSAYYERRKKNNAAAKKSRDRRRIKEDEIAIRATYLENENREYHTELVSARNHIAELKIELDHTRQQLLALQGGKH